MNDHKLLTEAILVHLLAWWGIRTLLSQASVLHVFDANTPAWFAIRLARAGLAVAVVLVWARWRKIVWQDLGLGGQYFWRSFGIAFGAVAVLWFIVVTLSGNPLEAPHPINNAARALAAIIAFVDVLAQQLPTFGLLQGLGMKHGKTAKAFGLALCSFTSAHLIGSSLPIVFVSVVMGLLFGAFLWRTKHLGAALGKHASFYFMRAIFGWGA